MSDVFISYKAEDRSRVEPLVDALEAEDLTVWWDARVSGGEAWRESIAEHLDAAKCVIVVWSKRSTGPEGRFVRDEATRAQKRGTYLPVRIDKVDPPLGFGEVQALPLNGWKGDRSDARYRAVSHCVHGMLGRKVAARTAPAPQPTRKIDRRTALVAGGAAVVAAGAGGWLLLRPSGTKANTLAVLPFANLSGDPSQNYFSDGMAEEVRSALAAISGLQVVARTSSEMLRNVDAITAARRLSVANVITGSVRRSTSTVRVSAQLIDGESGLERWSQSFDRPFGDVLQIQSDIATNVARALRLELGNGGPAALALGGTRIAEAQDYLLQALATEGDDSSAAFRQRVALLDRAVRLDPNYAEAHARKGLSQSLWANAWAGSIAEKQRSDAEALRSARRAIQIAPSMPLGHSAVGVVYLNQLAMKQALEALRRAVEFPGADPSALNNYALALSRARRQGEAETMIERAIVLDPLNPTARVIQSWILFHGRKYPQSIKSARQALSIAPQNLRAPTLIAWDLFFLGRTDEAVRELQQVPADDYRRLVGEGAIAARTGRRADALRAIDGLKKHYGDTVQYQLAQVYAQLGDRDNAIAALEAGWSARDSGLTSMQVDPFLDPLRQDPRFKAIEGRLNFPR